MKNLIKAGHLFYCICIAGLGIQQFQYASIRPVIAPQWPAWLQVSPIAAYLTGIGLLAASAIIAFGKNGKSAALLLGGVLLLLFAGIHAIYQLFIIEYSFHLGLWTNALKELALAGGAFVAAGYFAEPQINAVPHSFPFLLLEKLIPVGKVFFCITMISFGIDHFLYTEFVSTLVPSWIPGPVFWSYFAGVALIGSGIAIIINAWVRPVAILLGVMLFIWFVILHLPRAYVNPSIDNGNEITSVLEALGFSGIAFMIAGKATKNRTNSQFIK